MSDPAECKDQKGGGGTFDMFDAKLGNCVFYLGSRPQKLPGFENAPPCDERRAATGCGYKSRTDEAVSDAQP